MNIKYTSVSDGKLLHWAVDPTEDFVHACELDGTDVGLTCPQCLGMIVSHLSEQLMEARHALATSNPEGWECVENCQLCKEQKNLAF